MAGKKSDKAIKKKVKKEKSSKEKSSKEKSTKRTKKTKPEEIGPKLVSLERKQKEIARVVQLKTAIIMSGTLSFLEYNELREELMRLNNLKEVFKRQVAELQILSL